MILKTDTHIHTSRTVARRAAEAAGLNLDDLVIYQAAGKWGWRNAEEYARACEADDARGRGRRNKVTVAEAAPETAPTPSASVVALVDSCNATLAEIDAHFGTGAVPAEHPVLVVNPEIADTFGLGGLVGSGLVRIDAGRGEALDIPPVPTIDALPEPTVDTGDYEPEPTAQGVVPANVVSLGTQPLPDGEVVVQIATRMLPYAARSLAEQLLKRYGVTVLIRDAETLALRDTVAPKVKGKATGSVAGPRLVRDWSVRPVINSKHHLHVEKILDRIDDCNGDVPMLEHLTTTFKPSCTYYKMAWRYLHAKLEEARAAEAAGETETPPGVDLTGGAPFLLADAAD
jgi:hypothetical protein